MHPAHRLSESEMHWTHGRLGSYAAAHVRSRPVHRRVSRGPRVGTPRRGDDPRPGRARGVRPSAIETALGRPHRGGLFSLHHSPELTILNVVWAPGMTIYPHEHRMWAVIGLYGGREDNTFYRRGRARPRRGGRRAPRGERTTALLGETVIHAVANPLRTFTGAIHVYGGDFFAAPRSEWTPDTLVERPFDMERARRTYAEANAVMGTGAPTWRHVSRAQVLEVGHGPTCSRPGSDARRECARSGAERRGAGPRQRVFRLHGVCEYGRADMTILTGGSWRNVHEDALASIVLLVVVAVLRRRVWRSRTSSARSPSRRPATPRCRRSSSAAWRCCTRTGSAEARKTFDAVIQQDPSCAMAYWGLAVELSRQLAGGRAVAEGPARRRRRRSRRRARSGRRPSASATGSRRSAPTIAITTRCRSNTRLAAYTKAMEQLTQRYPDDFEAWVYYALTLQASAPKNDKTYANQLKSAEILERLFKQNPEHPGVAHYLVHAYDYPPLADKGIKIARALRAASRRPRRTPGTCRRTSTRWSACGRSRSPRTGRRSRSSPTIITRPTSSSTRTCSSRRTPRPRRWSTRSPRCRKQDHPEHRRLHGRRRDPRALRARARRLGRRRRAAGRIDRTPAGRLARALHARARHGAQRRSRRREARDPGDAGAARPRWRSRTSPTGPIGPRSRCSPSPRGSPTPRASATQAVKLMRAAADGEDAQRQARGDGEPALSDARAARRAAAPDGTGARPRCASSRRRSRRIRTAIAASTAPRAPPRRRATGRRPRVTTRSSSRWPARPTRRGRRSRARRRFSASGEPAARALAGRRAGTVGRPESLGWRPLACWPGAHRHAVGRLRRAVGDQARGGGRRPGLRGRQAGVRAQGLAGGGRALPAGRAARSRERRSAELSRVRLPPSRPARRRPSSTTSARSSSIRATAAPTNTSARPT